MFHLEVIVFKKIFKKMLSPGYPSSFIDNCINTFLDKIFRKKVIRSTVPRKEYFIILPYLGPLSTKIQKPLKCVLQNVIPWGEINLTFKITHISL